MNTFTRKELEDSDLLLVVGPDGSWRFSSSRSDAEIASMLEAIAKKLRERNEQ